MQCCLVRSDKTGKFIKQIDRDDCGADWGICADVNEDAFDKFGEHKVLDLLFKTAKKAGYRII